MLDGLPPSPPPRQAEVLTRIEQQLGQTGPVLYQPLALALGSLQGGKKGRKGVKDDSAVAIVGEPFQPMCAAAQPMLRASSGCHCPLLCGSVHGNLPLLPNRST